MSRSRKHFPSAGITTCRSEKEGKRIANRILRSMAVTAIRKCSDYDGLIVPIMREAVNVWSMGKDGKHIFDPKRHPALMRK